ncbi:glycosyltransferase family 2 protein [Agaribacterium haliotis]|uniref:glycosyltransferase family 2 protein n=1 Tax=Agaribacterium haliotis TaxID=2013869 RepID=UPI001303F969|nr:glycosyltransferase family 2 protein [Agaribacterium haliotis]
MSSSSNQGEQTLGSAECLRFSIVVPVYNNLAGVSRIVEWFVKQQLHARSVELVIVDDGSKPAAEPELAPGVRYFYQENTGVSGARNFGLEQSLGEYVCFLDSDDTYDDKFIDIFEQAVEAGEFDMLVSPACYVSASGKAPRSHQLQRGLCSSDDFLNAYFRKLADAHVCSILLRRQFLLGTGLKFDRQLYLSEDIYFIICCAAQAEKIFVESEVYFNYFLVEGSATNRLATEKVLNHFSSFSAILNLPVSSSLVKARNYFVATMYVHFLIKLLSNKTNSQIVIDQTVSKKSMLSAPMIFSLSLRGVFVMFMRLISLFPDSIWRRSLAFLCRPAVKSVSTGVG